MAYLGIDLGTTYSAAATLDAAGQPAVLPNAEGELTTASAVLFESGREVVVGREALRAAAAEPQHVAVDVKRFMGDDEYPRPLRGRRYSPVVLSAMVLKKVAQDAAKRAGPIEGAVVTVPAYFNEARRQATAAACAAAGLPLLDIINEPTAAALAFAYRELSVKAAADAGHAAAACFATPRTLVVYDLGGGTFDVTVLRCEGQGMRVLATAGDVQLGGRDWDERLVEHLATRFVEAHGGDPRGDPLSHQQLRDAAEQLKKELSRRDKARYAVHHGGHTLGGTLGRGDFEAMTADLLYRTRSRLDRVMKDAGVGWADVHDVLMVGGSTRMPAVRAMLEDVSGRPPDASLSPDEAVAQGAAIYAAMCVARGDPPAAQPAAGRSGAAGAGSGMHSVKGPVVQAPAPAGRESWLIKLGRLAGLLRSLETSAVAAHSLGIVAHSDAGKPRVVRMIDRNTPLPAEVKRTFGTQSNRQRHVTVRVVEGESRKVEHCYPLGNCVIAELPPSLPRGSPIEVTFRYDASGRFHLEALHVESGTWAATRIERRGGVDPDRVQHHRGLLAEMTVS